MPSEQVCQAGHFDTLISSLGLPDVEILQFVSSVTYGIMYGHILSTFNMDEQYCEIF